MEGGLRRTGESDMPSAKACNFASAIYRYGLPSNTVVICISDLMPPLALPAAAPGSLAGTVRPMVM